MVSIPADKEFSSLNLASAVQILAYEIYRATLAGKQPEATEPRAGRAVSDEDMQRFYRHMQEVLQQIGFLDPANPRRLMRRLMRLFNRVVLDHNEMNILRGILTAVQQHHEKLDKNNQE
jgi:tRNA C32,U32 (ribose-2'-O)-methylase TrmJ